MAASSTGVYVHESGDPESPAIVFLQGVGASGGMWEEHMHRLAGYHCSRPTFQVTGGALAFPGDRWSTRPSRWPG